MSYVKIASVELTGAETKVQFTGIPSTFNHLEIVWSVGNGASVTYPILLTFNDVTAAASYAYRSGEAKGTSEVLVISTSDTSIQLTQGNGNNFGRVFIPHYSDSSTNLVLWSANGGWMSTNTGVWGHCVGVAGTGNPSYSTNAQYTLSSVELLGTFAAGDKFDIYGI